MELANVIGLLKDDGSVSKIQGVKAILNSLSSALDLIWKSDPNKSFDFENVSDDDQEIISDLEELSRNLENVVNAKYMPASSLPDWFVPALVNLLQKELV